MCTIKRLTVIAFDTTYDFLYFLGETDLLKAISHLCNVDDRELALLQEIKALNQLGILWCLRDDYEKAGAYLQQSLVNYQNFMDREEKKYLYETVDLFQKGNGEVKGL